MTFHVVEINLLSKSWNLAAVKKPSSTVWEPSDSATWDDVWGFNWRWLKLMNRMQIILSFGRWIIGCSADYYWQTMHLHRMCCLWLQHSDVCNNLKRAEQALTQLDDKVERVRQVAPPHASIWLTNVCMVMCKLNSAALCWYILTVASRVLIPKIMIQSMSWSVSDVRASCWVMLKSLTLKRPAYAFYNPLTLTVLPYGF